jgi:hypothetical protein
MPDSGIGAPGGRSLTRDKLVSLQFRICFWILTEKLPKRITCVFRCLGLAWLGYLDMFKDLELRYGERVSIPKCEVGLGTESWAPFMSGAHPRAGRVTTVGRAY